MRVLVIAGLADSLLNFRGPLLIAMMARGLEVHVAAPDLHESCSLRKQLLKRGLKVHDIPLRRAGTNLLADLHAIWVPWGFIRYIEIHLALRYTVNSVFWELCQRCWHVCPTVLP